MLQIHTACGNQKTQSGDLCLLQSYLKKKKNKVLVNQVYKTHIKLGNQIKHFNVELVFG